MRYSEMNFFFNPLLQGLAGFLRFARNRLSGHISNKRLRLPRFVRNEINQITLVQIQINRLGGQKKVKKICVLLLFASLISASCAFRFGYPVEGEGWYYIRTSFPTKDQLEKGTWEIIEVSVNGMKARDFLLYQGKKEIFQKKIEAESPFEVKIRYSWEGDKEYEIQAKLRNTETEKLTSLRKTIQSPSRTR